MICGYVELYFFFSSRRRHTRCSRDWSSDVCSSDLTLDRMSPQERSFDHVVRQLGPGRFAVREQYRRDRSEERRVGKECRSRRSPDPKKKKIEDQSTMQAITRRT